MGIILLSRIATAQDSIMLTTIATPPSGIFSLQMTNIPAGTFIMGSPSTEVGRSTDETLFASFELPIGFPLLQRLISNLLFVAISARSPFTVTLINTGAVLFASILSSL